MTKIEYYYFKYFTKQNIFFLKKGSKAGDETNEDDSQLSSLLGTSLGLKDFEG